MPSRSSKSAAMWLCGWSASYHLRTWGSLRLSIPKNNHGKVGKNAYPRTPPTLPYFAPPLSFAMRRTDVRCTRRESCLGPQCRLPLMGGTPPRAGDWRIHICIICTEESKYQHEELADTAYLLSGEDRIGKGTACSPDSKGAAHSGCCGRVAFWGLRKGFRSTHGPARAGSRNSCYQCLRHRSPGHLQKV